jgi:hypothetical protein
MPRAVAAFGVPAQPVDATQALNLSAGVSNCKEQRLHAGLAGKSVQSIAQTSRQ